MGRERNLFKSEGFRQKELVAGITIIRDDSRRIASTERKSPCLESDKGKGNLVASAEEIN